MYKALPTIALLCYLCCQCTIAAVEIPKPRKKLPRNAIAITKPGYYAEAGKTYVLMRDIKADGTALYLGNNVTLDLNGHSITFAAADYKQVPNYGFEEGLKHWDISKAPGAKAVDSNVMPIVGTRILELPVGEEIVSDFVHLPVANRSYYATCANDRDQRIELRVEDENGKEITCNFQTSNGNKVGCPVLNKKLPHGGGVIFAHLHNLPAGKYRIRVKALASNNKSKTCYLDEINILPALDAGIAMVSYLKPFANYDAVMAWHPCAFFDANKNAAQAAQGKAMPFVALDGLPLVSGKGTITIKNGVIKNGSPVARSYAIHANSGDALVVLDNVLVQNSGLNANAASLGKAKITNSRFEINTPFIINRHYLNACSVTVSHHAEEIAFNEFIGGQGNLYTPGGNGNIHDNYFENHQTVVNHYTLTPGTGDKVYKNKFHPKRGAGINLYRCQNVEVYDNEFKIHTMAPPAEYRYKMLTTPAIRMADYGAKKGSKDGSFNNKIYQNTFHITGKNHMAFKGYQGRATAFFVSANGGQNYIYDNDIILRNDHADDISEAYAFFIGSSNPGGEIKNNRIDANCTVGWMGNYYGNADNVTIINNTFKRHPQTPKNEVLFRLGNGGNAARNIRFISNQRDEWKTLSNNYTQLLSYTVESTLFIQTKPGATVQVTVPKLDKTIQATADKKGHATVHVPVYRQDAKAKTQYPSANIVAKLGEWSKNKQVQVSKDMKLKLK